MRDEQLQEEQQIAEERTGQIPHRATRAVQTSAPSSMMPWLNAHADFPDRGTSRAAVSQSRA
jgi:hypothetical protein